MPPAGQPQPPAEERDRDRRLVEDDYLAARCGDQAGAGAGRDPAAQPAGIRQHDPRPARPRPPPADAFPPDDIGFGFDNVGPALSISPPSMSRNISTPPNSHCRRRLSCPTPRDSPPAELIGLKTLSARRRTRPVEFKHSLKPGRYLADFSLVRVGIAESVPPPRLVIGFAKDRRPVDAVRVQDETVVYRYWLEVAEGDKLVHVQLAPRQSGAPPSSSPGEIAANVSGDQRYGDDRGLARRFHGRARPRPAATPSFPSRIGRSCSAPPDSATSPGIDCARQVIARFVDRAYRWPVAADEVERILKIFRLADERGESLRTRRPARPDDRARLPPIPVPESNPKCRAKTAR